MLFHISICEVISIIGQIIQPKFNYCPSVQKLCLMRNSIWMLRGVRESWLICFVHESIEHNLCYNFSLKNKIKFNIVCTGLY